MIKKLNQEEMLELLTKMSEYTHNSWLEILEALSKLSKFDCYKDLGLLCENKLKTEAMKLN